MTSWEILKLGAQHHRASTRACTSVLSWQSCWLPCRRRAHICIRLFSSTLTFLFSPFCCSTASIFLLELSAQGKVGVKQHLRLEHKAFTLQKILFHKVQVKTSTRPLPVTRAHPSAVSLPHRSRTWLCSPVTKWARAAHFPNPEKKNTQSSP